MVQHAAHAANGSPSTETMQVVARLRPLSPIEQARGDTIAFNSINDQTLGRNNALPSQQRAWAFDRVFGSGASNDDVYAAAVQPLVLSAMEGFNACVFAYGQTASGKTFTMKAVTQAAAADVFAHVAASPDREWLIRASAIEIYNEDARDMLRDEGGAEPLRPRPDRKRGTVFEGLHEEGVHSAQHLLRLLKSVDFRRQVCCCCLGCSAISIITPTIMQVRETKMNECSSRSHLVIRLHIESRPIDPCMADGMHCSPTSHTNTCQKIKHQPLPRTRLGRPDSCLPRCATSARVSAGFCGPRWCGAGGARHHRGQAAIRRGAGADVGVL